MITRLLTLILHKPFYVLPGITLVLIAVGFNNLLNPYQETKVRRLSIHYP